MENVCPNSANCPIFNGILSGKEMTSRAYKTQFCESGEDKWNTCKRLLIKKQYGKCPPDLLPNASLTIEQIAAKYNLIFLS